MSQPGQASGIAQLQQALQGAIQQVIGTPTMNDTAFAAKIEGNFDPSVIAACFRIYAENITAHKDKNGLTKVLTAFDALVKGFNDQADEVKKKIGDRFTAGKTTVAAEVEPKHGAALTEWYKEKVQKELTLLKTHIQELCTVNSVPYKELAGVVVGQILAGTTFKAGAHAGPTAILKRYFGVKRVYLKPPPPAVIIDKTKKIVRPFTKGQRSYLRRGRRGFKRRYSKKRRGRKSYRKKKVPRRKHL